MTINKKKNIDKQKNSKKYHRTSKNISEKTIISTYKTLQPKMIFRYISIITNYRTHITPEFSRNPGN